MGEINQDTFEYILLMVGVLALALIALICYLIGMLARVEATLRRINRLLRPEVLRDTNGYPIRERL